MGLELTKPSVYGIDANYWKIMETHMDWHTKDFNIKIAGWPTYDMRMDPINNPLVYQEFNGSIDTWPFSDADEDKDSLRVQAYNYIKTQPGWEEALDAL